MPPQPAVPSVHSATLERAFGCAYTVRQANSAGLLVDAAAYYREFYRAALAARRSILLSGWQFDSKVALLRGPEAEQAPGPVTLLAFLNWLCEQKPELRIWILAWDFHLIFAAEREWMQRLAFHWMTNERLHFRFDAAHVDRGSHHQKFVVIDGALSFLGGLDLCDHRWDDPHHKNVNPLRVSRGEPHQPFHDIQAYVHGVEPAAALQELFVKRWERAGGEAPPAGALEPTPEVQRLDPPAEALQLPAARIALSRTDPYGSPCGPADCTEILDLHVQAIAAAERLIYLETQYFSSHALADALEARMRAADRTRLEIVMVLNMEGETLKEQAAVGLAQAQIIGRLRQLARETGHALGIYYTVPSCDTDEPPQRATYIHSKLMIVDDRLLTVGSANLTNRSMSVDTELNLSVYAEYPEDGLASALRHVRGALLAEHTGGEPIEQVAGLVAQLEQIAERGAAGARREPCRLRRHPSPTPKERAALELIDPQDLPFDPDEDDLKRGPGRNLMQTLERVVKDMLGGKGIA
jgi:phospholipase D1/2